MSLLRRLRENGGLLDVAYVAVAAVVGVLAAVIYADYIPQHSSKRVDGVIESAVKFTRKYITGERDFDTDLVAAVNARVPDLQRLPALRRRLLIANQLVSLPDPSTQEEAFEYQVQDTWCDRIPQWTSGGNYTPSGDKRISQEYKNFLSALKRPEQTSRYQAAVIALSVAFTRQLSALGAGGNPASGAKAKKPSKKEVADSIAEQQVVVRNTMALMDQMRPEDAAELEARLALLDYSYKRLLPDDAGIYRWVRSCQTTPDLRSALVNEKSGSASFEAAGRATVMVKPDAATAGAESQHGIDATIEIQGSRVEVVTLDRSSWFNSGLVREKSLGPWAEGFRPQFWGKDGDFSLIPEKLVVLVEPRVKLTLPISELRAVQSALGADNLAINLGPMTLKPGDFKASAAITGGKVVIQLRSSTATVLGVVVRVMP